MSDRRSEVHIISKTQWATPQRGTFWVAGADDRVHGALSGPGSESLVVDSPLLLPDLPEATGGVISLTGELDEMVLDLVHGVLHDGTEVTLVRLRRYTWLLEAFADKSSQQQWEARAVVTGAHLSSDEAHRIRTLSVETDYSLDWSQAGAPGANATQHVMAEGESDLGQVKVIDATDTQRSIASASFTRRAWIEVDFRDPVDVETVVATIAQDLLSLVSFAVGKPDRVVYIGAVIDDLSAPVEIHVDYLEHGDDRDESRVHVSRQVLPLDEVPAGVGELLDAWLSLRQEHRGIVNLISTDRAPFQFLEQRFIAVIQAAEVAHAQWYGGYDLEPEEFERRINELGSADLREETREWAVRKLEGRNSPSLAERLRQLIEGSGLDLPRHVVEALVKAKNLRNPLSHGGTSKVEPEYVYWLTHMWLWIVRREVLAKL